jgi:hypothetical protein
MILTILLILWTIFLLIKYIFDSYQSKKLPRLLLVSPLILTVILYIGFYLYYSYLIFVKHQAISCTADVSALLTISPAIINLIVCLVIVLVFKRVMKKRS